tara:strand:+ start:2200 stop:2592 length:393 start_codon:yes stop_codon:yes gene_type:complete
MSINIPISYGELLDKLSILEIKKNKITDDKKLVNVNFEFETLKNLAKKIKNIDHERFTQFYKDLLKVNNSLWIIEDEIRILEKKQLFNKDFISLARSVYIENDKRFEIKNEINMYFKSDVAEQKQYIKYN